MAGISDDNFKAEMLRMMKTAILKIDDNSKEINLLKKDTDKSAREFKNLKKEFRVGSSGLSDLRGRVLEMHNCVAEAEMQLKSFNERLPDLKEEIKKVSSELLWLMANVEDDTETRLKIDELYSRLEKSEEEVFAFA